MRTGNNSRPFFLLELGMNDAVFVKKHYQKSFFDISVVNLK